MRSQTGYAICGGMTRPRKDTRRTATGLLITFWRSIDMSSDYKATGRIASPLQTKRRPVGRPVYESDPELTVPVHKLFHAIQGFFELAVFSRIAQPCKPIAAGAKCIARHNGNMFFAQ